MANFVSPTARNAVGRIAQDAAVAVEREHGTQSLVSAGNASNITRAFCGSSAPVPATGAPPAGQKYQSTSADWNSGDASKGWQCLEFSLEEPQYYEYEYTSPNTSGDNGSFTATAHGDLNGDGLWSTFSVSGAAFSGAVAISPNVQELSPEE